MYYVYVLKSKKDGKWYTGYARNLQKRIADHNSKKNFSTKHRLPLQLIYFEASMSGKDTRAREKFLKSGMGKRYIKNRLKFFFVDNTSNGL